VRGVAEALQIRTDQHSIKVRAPEHPVLISCDSDRLGQVLTNLLTNALVHTAAGTIEVDLQVEDQEARIRVSDEGPGIPAADLERVFDAGFRGPYRANEEPESGSGLGLHIAKRIVEAHGGHISAENRPERGAVFTIALPVKLPSGVGTGSG
jgi:two-component system sensor histidine kinase KdpD